MVDETLVALTRDRAAEIAGLSQRQVAYWSSTGLVTPTVDKRLTPQRPIRLYGYVELMSLMVAAELKRRGATSHACRGPAATSTTSSPTGTQAAQSW